MSRSPLKRNRANQLLMLAVLLGTSQFLGCGNPGEGTVQVPPGARRFRTDPVTKKRPDAEKYKKAAPPGRGRMVE